MNFSEAAFDADEPLMAAMANLIHGKTVDKVIPVLIVASARALSQASMGDNDRLEDMGVRFCDMVADLATEMLAKEKLH